jgi:DNA-binding transcriptional LysR family regulator
VRTEQLEYFAAVARCGSFRRAADELHLSQPALSESVRNLERELGIDVLDRRRSGATISDEGRELLPHMLTVIEAVDRLRLAANHQHEVSRIVRLGTVNAATSPLVTPTIRRFRETHPSTQVEVISARQEEIHRGLLDGALDLGLVNYLEDDDIAPEFRTTELVRGRAVVCVRTDSALAAKSKLRREDLLDEPLVMMRPGYVMNRYVHRLLDGRAHPASYSTDGAEMGKLMVAEGLGATVLPDFSVIGDPLERQGTITYREIEDDSTDVVLVIQQRRSDSTPQAVRDLHQLFVDQALTHWPLAAA